MKNYPEILRSIGGYFDEAAQREISCAEIADHIEKMETELAALRQQQGEPVACMYVNSDGECEQIDYGCENLELEGFEPLYRKAAPRVPEQKE